MTPIEIMALAVVVFAASKLLLVLIGRQKTWFGTVTKRFWANSTLTTLTSLAVAVVALIYLLKELTIVQIFAAMFFAMSLIAMGLAPFSKDMLSLEDKWFKSKDMLKKGWFAAIVWIALIIWLLYALFA